MHLKDLQGDERLALVALSRAIARADGSVSAKEGEAIAEMAREIGEDVYRQAFAESARRFGDEAALKAFLQTIRRQEARQLIFDTILELAVSDALDPAESALVRWLDTTWKLTPVLE